MFTLTSNPYRPNCIYFKPFSHKKTASISVSLNSARSGAPMKKAFLCKCTIKRWIPPTPRGGILSRNLNFYAWVHFPEYRRDAAETLSFQLESVDRSLPGGEPPSIDNIPMGWCSEHGSASAGLDWYWFKLFRTLVSIVPFYFAATCILTSPQSNRSFPNTKCFLWIDVIHGSWSCRAE